MKQCFRPLLVSVALMSMTATVCAEEAYDIKLNRPIATGQQLQITAHASDERSLMTVQNGMEQEIESSGFTVSFGAVAKILDVDAMGRPTQVSYTVEHCMQESDGQETEIAAAGSTLVAQRGHNQTIFMINNMPVDESFRPALQLVAGLDGQGATDDEVLGTEQPRNLGEAWPINLEAAIADIEQQVGHRVSKHDISGTSRLVDVKDHHGHPSLVIRSTISAENVIPSMIAIPQGMQMKQASMTATYQGVLPQDDRMPMLNQSTRIKTTAILAGAMGPNRVMTEVHMNGKRVVQVDAMPMDDIVVNVDVDSITE